jgi:hypothetical protein
MVPSSNGSGVTTRLLVAHADSPGLYEWRLAAHMTMSIIISFDDEGFLPHSKKGPSGITPQVVASFSWSDPTRHTQEDRRPEIEDPTWRSFLCRCGEVAGQEAFPHGCIT